MPGTNYQVAASDQITEALLKSSATSHSMQQIHQSWIDSRSSSLNLLTTRDSMADNQPALAH